MSHPQPCRPSAATPRRAEPACADIAEDFYLLPQAVDAADPAGDATPMPAMEAALPELISPAEVATYFGRDVRTIRRWRACGLLPAVLIGGAVFYRLEDIRQMLSDRLVGVILKASKGEKSAKTTPDACGSA